MSEKGWRVVGSGRGWNALPLGVLMLVSCGSPARVQTHAPAASRAPVASTIVANLEREAMQRDLELWLATLEAVHPDPYTKVSRADFHAQVRAAEAALPATEDAFVYYGTLQRLAARLRDSHTSVWYPRASNAYAAHLWPLDTIVSQGRLFVEHDLASLPKGSELTRVNRFSAGELLLAASALTSAEYAEAAEQQAPASIAAALWLAGERAPFRVTAASPSGQELDVVVEGISPSSPRAAVPEEPYALRWVDTDVADLVITSMTDVDGFAKFIASTTSELASKHARGLIVDLRENHGGSTLVGERLLERITTKPYRMVAEKHWRVSKQYQRYQAQMAWKDDEYLAAAPGTTLHYAVDAQPPRPVSERYLGPVCFLIGPNTVSAAMMLANAAADYHLATLIGEPTTSPPNYFGEVYRFELPFTHLQAQASVARFVRANGDATNPEPVLPDVRISTTIEQWSRGEDPVLARALLWIESGS